MRLLGNCRIEFVSGEIGEDFLESQRFGMPIQKSIVGPRIPLMGASAMCVGLQVIRCTVWDVADPVFDVAVVCTREVTGVGYLGELDGRRRTPYS